MDTKVTRGSSHDDGPPSKLQGVDWAVARGLGKTRFQVYAAARKGLIPCVRLGRKILFDPEAIERHIANGGGKVTRGRSAADDGGGFSGDSIPRAAAGPGR